MGHAGEIPDVDVRIEQEQERLISPIRPHFSWPYAQDKNILIDCNMMLPPTRQ
jgi:hypothetical protein